MSELRHYKCEFYECDAPKRSCLFCRRCTDVLWDYTNGPYLFICDRHPDIAGRVVVNCEYFEEEEPDVRNVDA